RRKGNTIRVFISTEGVGVYTQIVGRLRMCLPHKSTYCNQQAPSSKSPVHIKHFYSLSYKTIQLHLPKRKAKIVKILLSSTTILYKIRKKLLPL
ncbi:MAG: hypothetical protein K6A95_09025, partial [Bacteroidales bacterium]|nr:hypothetical protein [Bacteroidales bacterium]